MAAVVRPQSAERLRIGRALDLGAGGMILPQLQSIDEVRTALAAQQGNISRTADALGVERSNLYRKMKAFGIAPVRRVDEEEEPA
mgnify:CR=1 FL=1